MIRKTTAAVLGAAAGLVIAAAVALPGVERDELPVQRVVDGDTIIVGTEHGEERVRIIGIDTPELKGHECYSAEAKSFAGRMLDGKWVILKGDRAVPDRDRYGRLLRYVEVDGVDYGEQAIETGMAVEYTVSNQRYQRRIEYRTDTLDAQRAGTGRWGACR